MRTLHLGLRVSDLERSLAFYGAVGYQVIGSVPETSIGRLTMLKLPQDEFVTLELVSPGGEIRRGNNLSHFVVQVESMEATVRALAAHGIEAEGLGSPDDTADFLTAKSPTRRQHRRAGAVAARPRRRHHRRRLAWR